MPGLPIMSVSGIRGVVDDTLTPVLVSRIAYLQTRASLKHGGSGTIVVGRDTRTSGVRFAQAAFRGIRAAGGVPVDIGIAPTPTTCVATSALSASGGIIVTASHNPDQYNGYKMVHASGRLFRAAECEEIYAAFRNGSYPSDVVLCGFSDTAQETVDAAAIHLDRICAQVDVALIRSAGIRVAIDSINGAAGAVFPRLLEKLGVAWVGVNNRLDGTFTHNPEPRPEHLTELASLLKSGAGTWGGFAFDPDADRLATMSESGGEISEEMTIVFCLRNILSHEKSDVAVNLSTSMLIDDIATRFGVNVVRTKIGEANVVEGMEREGCTVGGEGNGGLIYPAISLCRDGPAALAIIIELMAKTGKKLSQLAAEWPVYAIVKEKIPLGAMNPAEAIARLAASFPDEKTDLQDGLKIIRPNGWVHLRSSNTEPIIRCYAEARTPAEARELAAMVMEKIAKA